MHHDTVVCDLNTVLKLLLLPLFLINPGVCYQSLRALDTALSLHVSLLFTQIESFESLHHQVSLSLTRPPLGTPKTRLPAAITAD